MTQTSPSRRSSPASPTGRPRDGLLDLLRSLSITRVIGIHLIGRSGFWFWPAPTYVLPGMPMVFFVSGALVRKTLGTVDGARRSALTYWRSTFRRLLVPYWAYYAVMVLVAVVADAGHTSDYWTVHHDDLLLGATGFVVPEGSLFMRRHTGHLWFMSAFLVLTLFAPLLVRLFERFRGLVMILPLSLFAWVEWRISGGEDVRTELDKLATFSVPYVAGFWYTENSFKRIPRWAFAAASAACAAGAWWYDGIRPGAVNASGIKHLLVGGAWLAASFAAAPQLRRVADRFRTVIDRISRRTFTIFLWGWTTSVVAWDRAGSITDGVWQRRSLYWVFALALLAAAVAAFGWVEDVAAGRTRRSTALRPSWTAPRGGRRSSS
ncbi:MAG TPA: acyltransferase [Microthrixaceae bacterium]|nr:acyltransferase [Microthrixaceae bacterium]